jgi:Flp pilus assembly protein TadD
MRSNETRGQDPVARAWELLERGHLAEAEAACRAALAASQARDPQAWTALGAVLREQGRAQEAESAYQQALAASPGYIPAHHNLGALLSQQERAEEALAALDRAAALGLSARELYINRGRALAQLYRLDEAEQSYARAVALQPRDPLAQSSLAQLRYMRGDPDFARDLRAAVAANAGDLGLQLTLADLLRRSGDLAGTEVLLRTLLQKGESAIPELRSALAVVLQESGRLREAENEALEAATARPHDPVFLENLVVIELALGKPDQALPFIRTQRRRQPLDQAWIAYEASAARLMHDPRYSELYDYSRLVRVYELEPPPGWGSLRELNAALQEALRERHRFASHPLDQSLRHGSQTARSLLTERDAAIQALLGAFAAPIEDYRAAIGRDAAHPLTARNTAPGALRGCWSVELRRAGFHVNHVHPQGWISSAYYVSVPDEVADAQLKSGWLKFGEPRSAIPGAHAEHVIEPRAGRLVLFPSYMWHGTNPIHGTQPRLTVAFDVVPQRSA